MNDETQRRPATSRRGFTLIELLVVISIIALLISLLLPALSGARRSGQRVACMATLRSIGQGANAYSDDNDDAILGAPSTSGSMLVRFPPGPGIPSTGQQMPIAAGPPVQRWDFMGPLAEMMGLPIPKSSGALPELIERFKALRNEPAFLCKSNNFLATHFDGPPAGTGRMISYNTVRWQLFINATSGSQAGFPMDTTSGISWYPNNFADTQLPSGWRPKVNRLGVPANKVYCADGSRYSACGLAPDYDLKPHGAFGGCFSDAGAHLTAGPTSTYPGHSWDRTMAPGNGTPQGGVGGKYTDARQYSFRHSTGSPPVGAAANAYRLNLLFHDGHVETQGDLTASNPHQWLPKDTRVGTLSNHWRDTIAHFGLTTPYNVAP